MVRLIASLTLRVLSTGCQAGALSGGAAIALASRRSSFGCRPAVPAAPAMAGVYVAAGGHSLALAYSHVAGQGLV